MYTAAIPPTPDVEATKSAIEAMDAHRRASEQATRAATEAQQEAERYAASLEATRIAELPTATPVQMPFPTPLPTLIPTPTPTATPVPTQTQIPRATPQSASRDYFTRGSSQDDVLHVQGTPTEINTYNALGYERWNYGYSTVTFSLPDALVTEWRDTGNLNVR